MSVWHAVEILLIIVVAINILLTIGLVLRLRTGTLGPRAVDRAPKAGYRVDLSLDSNPWPDRSRTLLAGTVVVALISEGCEGCERFKRDINHAESVNWPVHVVIDGTRANAEKYADEVRSWNHVEDVHLAPASLDELESFGRPSYVPSIAILSDGIVLANSYTLTGLPAALSLGPTKNDESHL